MKKVKNLFFMLLIAMATFCSSAVYAEPETPVADNQSVQTEQTAAPASDAADSEKPTAEPTVAPELRENQIDVKEGAVELLFTVGHRDPNIDMSITSPKGAVLNMTDARVETKSISGGTVVRVADPEAGIWTMNASSMQGEAVTVTAKCNYNIVIKLESDKGVIYNGMSNTYKAYLRTKDGDAVAPEIARLAKLELKVTEVIEGQETKPETVTMLLRDGGVFEADYTYRKVGRLSITVDGIVNGAEISCEEPLDIIYIVDPDAGNAPPILLIVFIVVLLTIAGVVVYIKFGDKLFTQKKMKNMTGNLSIVITENGDDKIPVLRNLTMLGMTAGMYNIINDDRFYEINGLTIHGIENNGIRVINKSRCTVRFSNVGADPNGVNLFDGQYFRIFIPDGKTYITVTYKVNDINSGVGMPSAQQQMHNMVMASGESDTIDDFNEPVAEEETENVLEGINLSEATEDAVPEQTEDVVEEVSDEDVENMASFSIDVPEDEAAPVVPDADVDYTSDVAPALESFSFDMDESKAVEKETTEVSAEDEAASILESFSIAEPEKETTEVSAEDEAASILESFSIAEPEKETAEVSAEDEAASILKSFSIAEPKEETTEVSAEDEAASILESFSIAEPKEETAEVSAEDEAASILESFSIAEPEEETTEVSAEDEAASILESFSIAEPEEETAEVSAEDEAASILESFSIVEPEEETAEVSAEDEAASILESFSIAEPEEETAEVSAEDEAASILESFSIAEPEEETAEENNADEATETIFDSFSIAEPVEETTEEAVEEVAEEADTDETSESIFDSFSVAEPVEEAVAETVDDVSEDEAAAAIFESFNLDSVPEVSDAETVSETVEDTEPVKEETEEPAENMFADLESLANEAETESQAVKEDNTTVDFDDTEDLFDLQHLADELTKKD